VIVSAGCINILNKKTNKITFINTENGLPSNTIQSLQKDKNGIVWAGMTHGLCRINIKNKIVSYYDRRDGIAYDRFTMTGVEQLKDGELFSVPTIISWLLIPSLLVSKMFLPHRR
jgi:ligand-binding sensor domain-containing protein